MAVGPLLGDEGYAEEELPEAKGEGLFCQPCTLRISAEVWRRGRFVGGDEATERGCGAGGGGGT